MGNPCPCAPCSTTITRKVKTEPHAPCVSITPQSTVRSYRANGKYSSMIRFCERAGPSHAIVRIKLRSDGNQKSLARRKSETLGQTIGFHGPAPPQRRRTPFCFHRAQNTNPPGLAKAFARSLPLDFFPFHQRRRKREGS